MENMAEEELQPQEKEEVPPAQVPTSAADAARVPAPAPDSAPTPASAPAPAPALAQASALSPSLASAPDEAESSKCRRPRSFCCSRSQKVHLAGESPSSLGWFLWGKEGVEEWGRRRGACSAARGRRRGEGMSANLEDAAMKVMWRPGMLQNELEGFFVKGGLFPVQK